MRLKLKGSELLSVLVGSFRSLFTCLFVWLLWLLTCLWVACSSGRWFRGSSLLSRWFAALSFYWFAGLLARWLFGSLVFVLVRV